MSENVDVVVVGSGAAGLSAALAAAAAGAETLVLEASEQWGGTTSVSGGVIWVPDNHRMPEIGVADSLDDAFTYCFGHLPPRDRSLVETYVRGARAMTRFLESSSPIRFVPMRHPDTFAEHPGGKSAGRHLEVAPIQLGDACAREELGWSTMTTLTNDEVGGLLSGDPGRLADVVARRKADGQLSMGSGLVAGLLRGCRHHGVTLLRRCRVRGLIRDDAGSVLGVRFDQKDEPSLVRASRGVILAAGGFEHDPALSERLLGGRPYLPLSPPVSRGDGLRLAATAGAEISYVGDGWRWPAVMVPGETWGDPHRVARPRMMTTERVLPHVIWVNRLGRRFVNEAAHNCALALGETDPSTCHPRHSPVWAIGDAQFRRRYPVAGSLPGLSRPSWLIEADSLAGLAARIGLSGSALAETVTRFNRFANAGRDEDFGRGESAFERAGGDPGAPHPVLGTIEAPPYFALPVHTGLFGTQGGARTDDRGRALGWDGAPISGLYAAGNTMAAVFGPWMIANGLTLGTALTWGWLAGRTTVGAALEI